MQRAPGRTSAAVAATLVATLSASAAHAGDGHNGQQAPGAGYAFSAELGGFDIVGLSGLGTRADPIRIRGQVYEAMPVTLVIRAVKPLNPFAQPETHATGILHFHLDIENASGLPWVGAEFELQEVLGQPSVYGDGLSFDQRRTGTYPVVSDKFAGNRQNFEPYDRILFEDGFADPGDTVAFRFLTTDLTPVPVFYLRFDPRIPAS